MKIEFEKIDVKEIVSKIQEALGGRALGQMVKFEALKDKVVVTISKLGTSTLEFSVIEKAGKTLLELTSEKIGFTHKAFKGEVMEKISKVIQGIGGKIK